MEFKDNKNAGYALGRDFAVCVKIERKAIRKGEYAGLEERFENFTNLGRCPSQAFPVVNDLAHKYMDRMSRAEADFYEGLLKETFAEITDLPERFTMQEATCFCVGYYHQMAVVDQLEEDFRRQVVAKKRGKKRQRNV